MEYRLTEVDDDKCLFHVGQTQFFKLQSNTTPKAVFSFSMTSFTRLPPIPEKKKPMGNLKARTDINFS